LPLRQRHTIVFFHFPPFFSLRVCVCDMCVFEYACRQKIQRKQFYVMIHRTYRHLLLALSAATPRGGGRTKYLKQLSQSTNINSPFVSTLQSVAIYFPPFLTRSMYAVTTGGRPNSLICSTDSARRLPTVSISFSVSLLRWFCHRSSE
jgi:hypothetical protein